MSRWRRGLEREPDDWPNLPLRPGPLSNGEYVPAAPNAWELSLEREALARADRAARHLGIDRRRFLRTAGGVAAALSTYNLAACSGGGSDRHAAPPSTAGGRFTVPEPEDVEACAHALGGRGELVFDVHTHHVIPDGPWRENARRIADMIRGLVPAGCDEADPYRCVDRTAYLQHLFLASDTTVSLLSDVPNSGPLDAPLPWEAKRETRALADSLAAGGQPRVLLQDVLAPNFGDVRARLEGMEATVATGQVAAFKVYTAWGPGRRGYRLDDPVIGVPVVEQARALDVRIMCAHKGLPLVEFDPAHNGPDDVVAMAARYPDMSFVIYHSAYERQTTEGAYDPARAARGVNSLVKALDDHGIGPNANVFAELGTTWRETLAHPTEAAHVLGKLLRHVGTDNVLWGTDAIWYGSPQPQLMAFRAFEIVPELQERFGYPALTSEVKAKVLGLNAARLFGLDPDAVRCGIDADGLGEARARHASLVEDGVVDPWAPAGPVTRRQVLTWLRDHRGPWTPA